MKLYSRERLLVQTFHFELFAFFLNLSNQSSSKRTKVKDQNSTNPRHRHRRRLDEKKPPRLRKKLFRKHLIKNTLHCLFLLRFCPYDRAYFLQLSVNKIADEWFRTGDLWCQDRPLYHLRHNYNVSIENGWWRNGT